KRIAKKQSENWMGFTTTHTFFKKICCSQFYLIGRFRTPDILSNSAVSPFSALGALPLGWSGSH
ncbi:MAG: hypothetical protein KDC71_24165, partial [Acidobacteria bacterium]|nr:hypothetical protein [Acidobacteriota bacterium]